MTDGTINSDIGRAPGEVSVPFSSFLGPIDEPHRCSVPREKFGRSADAIMPAGLRSVGSLHYCMRADSVFLAAARTISARMT